MKKDNCVFLGILVASFFLTFLNFNKNLNAGILKTDDKKKGFTFDNDNDSKDDNETSQVKCELLSGDSSREVKLPNDVLCESDENRVSAAPTLKSFCDLSVKCEREKFSWSKDGASSSGNREVVNMHANGRAEKATSEEVVLRLFCIKPSDDDCDDFNSDQLIACAKEKMVVEAQK